MPGNHFSDTALIVSGNQVSAAPVKNAIDNVDEAIYDALNGDQTFNKLTAVTATTLTIASGAINASQMRHIVDTEGAAATDDLTQINGTPGSILFLRSANDARDVVIKHAVGNIYLNGGVDYTLTNSQKMLLLVKDPAVNKWYGIGVDQAASSGSELTDTGVTPGTYDHSRLTVDIKGRITSISERSGELVPLAGGRLTLVSNNPVGDVAAGTTLYYTPYVHDRIGLYDTTLGRFVNHTFTERSISLAAAAPSANTLYDVFIYDNAGTLALELVAWSSSVAGSSSRATNIERLQGVFVKTGDNTRRYLGTIRTTTAGTCVDFGSGNNDTPTPAQRLVWNYHNRIDKKLTKFGSGTHTYSSAAWRVWDNDVTETQMDIVVGVLEEIATVMAACTASNGGSGSAQIAFGVNGTSPVANVAYSQSPTMTLRSVLQPNIVAGNNYILALEYGSAGPASFSAILVQMEWAC